MGFPKSIKDRMLVASARHCCVCHRYKGVGVEVHHIIQEADGGENSFENAIALCFDCHAAAGHYNHRHPRGTKFSAKELRLARISWLEMVRKNTIHPAPESEDMLCRYYVCKHFEFLKNIVSLELSDLPVTNPLLCKNDVFYALVDLISRHPDRNRHETLWGSEFESEEDYLIIYPHPEDIDTGADRYPYYSIVRNPTQTELDSLKKVDGLVNAMIEYELAAEHSMALVGCYEAACAGIVFQEEYLLRGIWGVFLAVENVSDSSISLLHLEAICANHAGFESFKSCKALKECHVKLPRAPLMPGMTAIIPVTVLIPPLHPLRSEVTSTDVLEGPGGHYRSVSHCLMSPEQANECLTFGGVIQPISVSYRKSGYDLMQSIHAFDLTNFYEIDMNWGCGSCPHLFFLSPVTQGYLYKCELLRSCEGRLGGDTFVVPDGVFEIVIAELEDEVTKLVWVMINGKEVAQDIVLDKGDELMLSVAPGDVVELLGQYQVTRSKNSEVPTGRMRNSLVYNYLAGCKHA